MRAFIQCDFTGHPCNPNAFVAFSGLKGYECSFFRDMKNSLRTVILKKTSLLVASASLNEDYKISGLNVPK
ncbi:hypothetical protein NXW53_20440 [Bacteroides ovatus]|uniref:hypothetical protein n=1 Tax=Bacteroides ovatus TaxID=28116 RepID=UPI00189BABDD|nr:hypothetical protein [Bacteroides ovatus]MCS3130215.1 hypothetical protein [Bacteroides ovatus]MDC2607544.1 hypothetical protein [Bacteroides ovatus]